MNAPYSPLAKGTGDWIQNDQHQRMMSSMKTHLSKRQPIHNCKTTQLSLIHQQLFELSQPVPLYEEPASPRGFYSQLLIISQIPLCRSENSSSIKFAIQYDPITPSSLAKHMAMKQEKNHLVTLSYFGHQLS